MRLRLSLFWLVLALPVFASEPQIVELSPQAVQPLPPPPDASKPIPLAVKSYRWFSVKNYTGAVTWEIEGDTKSAWFKELDKPRSVVGEVNGSGDPTFAEIPAGAVVVYGKSKGTVKLVALGVIDGKAKRFPSITIAVDGAEPIPPVPPVPPVPPNPVAAKLFVVVVEEERSRTPEIAAVIGDTNYWSGLKAKGHDWRRYDKDTQDPVGKTYAGFVAGKVPTVVIADLSNGKVLGNFPLPSTAALLETEVNKYMGAK